MTDISSTTWFPVFTLVAGYIMKAISARLDHTRAVQRERENRKETRQIQIAERRADFQRQALLDLQEALQDLARAAGAIHHYNTMVLKKTEVWRHLLPEDLDLAFLNANRKCILLSVRVYDDEIRKQAQLFRTMTMNASSAKNERDALALIGQSMDLLPTLHEKIGERLRKIDDDEEQKTS
jgi:hypothetical protein